MGTPWQGHQFGSRGLIILFTIMLLGQQFGQLPLPSRSHSFPVLPCPVQSPPFESWVMVWWTEVWGLLWTDVGSYK